MLRHLVTPYKAQSSLLSLITLLLTGLLVGISVLGLPIVVDFAFIPDTNNLTK